MRTHRVIVDLIVGKNALTAMVAEKLSLGQPVSIVAAAVSNDTKCTLSLFTMARQKSCHFFMSVI